MQTEKTINICGQELQIRYCAASETGYEKITGKSATVFAPTVKEFDEKGKPKEVLPPEANTEDFIVLGYSSIAAAYMKRDGKCPIELADVLCDAQPEEVKNLIKTVIDLRNEWYKVPEIAAKDADAPQPSEENPSPNA